MTNITTAFSKRSRSEMRGFAIPSRSSRLFKIEATLFVARVSVARGAARVAIRVSGAREKSKKIRLRRLFLLFGI